jgi:HK97 gp10 family phage protein
MGRNTDLSIKANGLAKLRRDLKAIDKDLAKSFTDHLREIAKDVRDDARPRAPRKTGALQRSIKHSVRARGASVYSNLPYAGVQEWGGTIRPRGTPIEIRGRHFIYSAVDENTKHVEEELTRTLDVIADRHGFH